MLTHKAKMTIVHKTHDNLERLIFLACLSIVDLFFPPILSKQMKIVTCERL